MKDSNVVNLNEYKSAKKSIKTSNDDYVYLDEKEVEFMRKEFRDKLRQEKRENIILKE